MTFGMQVRRWWRSATVVQRWKAIGTGIALLGAFLAAIATGTPDRAVASAGSNVAQVSGSPEVTQSGLLGQTATTIAGDGLSGSPAGSLPSGAPSNVGSIAAPPVQTGRSSASPSNTGTVPTNGTAVPTTPVRLVASDRGVSPTTISIGFLPANLGGLSATGYALNVRTDAAQYDQALVDYVNRTGGVDGRKLKAYIRPTDPTSQSDQAAACQAMVNDDKVFGVVDVGSLSDTPAFDCLARQNHTPYVHNTIWDTKWLARSGGMEVGYPAAIDRITMTWARDLTAMHWFGSNAVVGILGDNCEATSPVIDNVLRPRFAAIPGVKKVVVAKSDCSPQGVVGQPPSFVPEFQADGVTHVVLVTSFVSAAAFMSAAQADLYHPKYTTSDWWQLSSDASAADFNPNQFDGAISISSLGLALPSSGRAPYPGGQRCEAVAKAAGMPLLTYDGRNQELWGFCDNFFLMIDALKRAGQNPTRQGWAAAVQHLGEHPSVMYGESRFAPGKVTGSDQVMTLQWQRGCTCYRVISGLRDAAA